MRKLLLFLSMVFCIQGAMYAQAVINEIYPDEDQVEIKNIGRTTVNLRGWVLDDGGNGVLNINGNTIFVCGQLALMPDEIAVVEVQSVHTSESGEFMLSNIAGTPISYVQWGVGFQLLSRPAFNAGIWDSREVFVKSFDFSSSCELIDEENRTNANGYLEQVEPTICKKNTACEITDIIVSNITCQDNGTSADDTDDFYTFVLRVEGRNLDDELDVSMNNTTVTPNVLPSGCIDCIFSTAPGSANGSTDVLTVSSAICSDSTRVQAPESCSPECLITHQIINLECNDNGTPSDPTDDYLEYILRVWGFNVSDTYIATYPNGNVIGPFEYGSVQNIDTRNTGPYAGDGDFILTITDAQDPSCTREALIADPGSCSPLCEFTSLTFFNVRCNMNGTENDQSDDLIEFDVEVQGFNVSDEYIISSEEAEIRPTTGSTLTITRCTASVDDKHLDWIEILIVNPGNSACSISDTLFVPDECQAPCILSTDSLAFICNNNETPTDTLDDYYQLYLSVSGTNTSDSFRLSASPLLSMPLVLAYNEDHLIDLEKDIDSRSPYAMTILDSEETCTGLTLNGQLQGPCSDDIVSNSELSRSRLTIYPNPVNDVLYYDLDMSLTVNRLEIYGMDGVQKL